MKKTSIQCGKEFELNESEISFYEGKGLELPKRCKDCRKENKKNKAKRNHYRKNQKNRNNGQSDDTKRMNAQNNEAVKQANTRVSSVEALTEPDKPETFLQKIKRFFGLG